MDSTGHMWTVLDRLRDTQIEHGHLLRAIADRQEQTMRLMAGQQRQILTAVKEIGSTPKQKWSEFLIKSAAPGLKLATGLGLPIWVGVHFDAAIAMLGWK